MYKPKYRITPYLLSLVDKASALKTWVELAPLKVAWLPALQKEARAKTAHFSTSIEGNPLSLAQVKAIDRGEKTGVSHLQEKEITNYLKVMQWIGNNADNTIDEKNLLYLHKILMKELAPEKKCGKYKNKQNYVIDEKGFRVLTPPTPKQTPKLIKELISWLKDKHSLIDSAIFHHQFVSIHPFSDGNGRMARAISSFILFQRDFDLHHIFSLDEFFAGNRKRYYQKLQQARELDHDLTYWIEYVAEGIVYTLKNVKKRIEDLQVTTSHPIQLSPSQEEALRILRDIPFARVSDLTKQMKITRSRVNQILSPLIEKGLVTKEGQSRATIYKLSLH